MGAVWLTVCYFPRSFTAVVSDTQFSSLGLVLVAILAQFAKVIGYHPMPHEEAPLMQRAVAVSASKAAGVKDVIPPFTSQAPASKSALDMGVVVERPRAEREPSFDLPQSTGMAQKTSTKELSSLPKNERLGSHFEDEEVADPVQEVLVARTNTKRKSRETMMAPAMEQKVESKRDQSNSGSTSKAFKARPQRADTPPSVLPHSKRKEPSAKADVDKSTNVPKKTSKKRKGGNAIDDLFAGLT